MATSFGADPPASFCLILLHRMYIVVRILPRSHENKRLALQALLDSLFFRFFASFKIFLATSAALPLRSHRLKSFDFPAEQELLTAKVAKKIKLTSLALASSEFAAPHIMAGRYFTDSRRAP